MPGSEKTIFGITRSSVTRREQRQHQAKEELAPAKEYVAFAIYTPEHIHSPLSRFYSDR